MTTIDSRFLMMNLLSALYWFDEALQAALKEAGIPNVSRAQSMLIANISAGEHRATRIARNLGVTRQAISLMLTQPTMIKRPVLDVSGRLTVGFKPDAYEAAFA